MAVEIQPSKYRRWLEELQKEVQGVQSFSDMSERLAALKLVIDIDEVNGRFGHMLQVLETKLSLDLDADVDYKEWSQEDMWRLCNLESLHEDPSKNLLAEKKAGKIMSQTYANHIAGKFAVRTNDLTESKSQVQLSSLIREGLEKIGTEVDTTNNAFAKAIEDSLLELRQTLIRINDRLNVSTFDESIYASLFNDLKNKSVFNKVVSTARENFQHWHDHEIIAPLDIEKLEEQRIVYIAELINTGILSQLTQKCNTKVKKSFEEQIDLEFLQEELTTKDQPAKEYGRFVQLFRKNGNHYVMVEPQIVGKYFFEHRHHYNMDDVMQFFRFITLLDCVQEKIKELEGLDGLILPENIDYKNTIFHPNLDVKRILMSLHPLAKEKLLANKSLWYVVYKYFAENGWLIDKMQTKFIRLINLIYVNLNLTQANNFKDIDKYYKNTKIKEWTLNEAQPHQNFEDYSYVAGQLSKLFQKQNFLLSGRSKF